MKVCVGIISYLPNNANRDIRKNLFAEEIKALNSSLGLPILVIAQNYKEEDKKIFTDNCSVDYYPPLGVTKARKLLRDKFLFTTYDYIILMDDDEIIWKSENRATKYLETIYQNPSMYIAYYKNYLRGCAISRFILEKIPFLNVNAQHLEGWDDSLYVACVKKLYPDKFMEFPVDSGLYLDIEESNRRYPSTWVNELTNWSMRVLNHSHMNKQLLITDSENFELPKEWIS